MGLLELTGENAKEYEEILGPDLADDLKRTNFRGIAVAKKDQGPAGALVYEIEEPGGGAGNRSTIRLFACPDDQTASELLGYYTEESVKRDRIVESRYVLPDETAADRCAAAGFTRETGESELASLSLEEAMKIKLPSKNLPDHIVSMSELSVTQYRRTLRYCLRKGQRGVLEDLAYLPMSWFEQGISACSVDEGEADGLFLVRATPTGVLMPVFLYAFGRDHTKDLMHMLAYSISRAAEHYPKDKKILINRSRKATRDLLEKLAPGLVSDRIYRGTRSEVR